MNDGIGWVILKNRSNGSDEGDDDDDDDDDQHNHEINDVNNIDYNDVEVEADNDVAMVIGNPMPFTITTPDVDSNSKTVEFNLTLSNDDVLKINTSFVMMKVSEALEIKDNDYLLRYQDFGGDDGDGGGGGDGDSGENQRGNSNFNDRENQYEVSPLIGRPKNDT
uniref:Uncharacterized protein n=1 Tax=Glossina morsitans morsitans TaxID=37546 RepID=A0A1B0GAI2_GLOMM